MEIKVGDTVRVRGIAGPKMAVVGTDGAAATVVWFAGQLDQRRDTFPIDALERTEPVKRWLETSDAG